MIESDGAMIVAGGRDFDTIWGNDRMYRVLRSIDRDIGPMTVICGMARGADMMAHRLAKQFVGWSVEEYPADWERYGKKAGYIRNEQMAEVASILIAFWDGESRGTKHMIDIALKKGLEVHVYHYTKNDLLKWEPVK